MKTVLTLSVALLALPLLGAEPEKTAAKPATTAAAPAPPVQTDSPLVAAAKRSKQARKKPGKIVITDATLNKDGSNVHVTTTETMKPINLPPDTGMRATPEMEAARYAERRKAAAAKLEAEKNAAAEKLRLQQEHAAARAEDDYLAEGPEVDPASPDAKPPDQKPPHR
jgi:hypothetical protein